MVLPALTLWALDRDRRGRAMDGVRARLRARRGQRDRQPDPTELRDRDGRRRPGRQRRRAQQRARPLRADPRARRRRDPDRHDRRRAVLLAQRRDLRGDDLLPAAHGPGAADRAGRPRRRRRAGRRRGGDPLRAPRAEARDPAGDDDRRRHPGVQLPGPAAAARPLHLRRGRRRLHGARGRDGGRLGRRGAGHGRPRPGQRAAARRRRRSASASFALLAAVAPTLPVALVALVPLGVRDRDLRRRGQLDPAARGGAGHARPGDGALLGRLPRLDPDRRADRRLALGGGRPAGRAGARRRGGARGGRRRGDRLRPPARSRVQRPASGARAQRGAASRPRRAVAGAAWPSGPGRGRGPGCGAGGRARTRSRARRRSGPRRAPRSR